MLNRENNNTLLSGKVTENSNKYDSNLRNLINSSRIILEIVIQQS